MLNQKKDYICSVEKVGEAISSSLYKLNNKGRRKHFFKFTKSGISL